MEAERSLVPTDRRLKRVQIDPSALAGDEAGHPPGLGVHGETRRHPVLIQRRLVEAAE